MKKITSFLTLALLLGGVSTAKADLVPELQGNMKVTVDTDYQLQLDDELATGEWYVLAQERDAEGFMFDVDSLDESSVVRYRSSIIYANPEFAFTATMGPALVRFEEGDVAGTYKIQFGTGRYVSQLASANESSQNLTAGAAEDAANLYVYVTKTDGVVNEGCWALNFASAEGEYQDKVDTNGMHNNWTGVVTWENGETTAATGNNIWKIYPATVTVATENEVVAGEVLAIVAEYEAKLSTFTNKTSEDGAPGTYSKALVDAINDAIDAAYDVEYYFDDLSVEEMRKLGQDIIDAYDAAIASYVESKWNVEPGYYFLASHKMFNHTYTPEVAEGEEPAEPVTELINKYMYSDIVPGTGIQAKWGSMATDSTQATFLWKVEKADDFKYLVKNAGTEAGFCRNLPAMSVESDSLIQFDYIVKKPAAEGSEESDTIFFSLRHIAVAEQPITNNNSFHINNHGIGADGFSTANGSTIVTWNGTAPASQWALIPVSDEDAQKMIEAYSDTKADKELLDKAKRIIADVKPKMEIALDVLTETSEPLITSVDQLSSPYTCSPDEEPGSGLDKLIDEDKNATYWHSKWSGSDASIATGHYLQVELNDVNVDSVLVEIGRRSSGSADHPTAFDVYGTDDAEATKDACELLGTIQAPYTNNTEVVKTNLVATGHKQFLRFYCTAVAPNNFRTYWHAGHFQIYAGSTKVNPKSQAVGMGEIFTNMQATVAAAEAQGDTISKANIEALIAAYEAFSARYVDPDTLRNTIKENENVAAIVVVGNKPGYWKDNTSAQALSDAIAAAASYDAEGVLYPAQSAGHVKAIEDAKKAFFAAANDVETSKWYKFRFATEKMYDDYEWDKTGATDNELQRAADTEKELPVRFEHWQDLYGKVASVGIENVTISDHAEHPDTALYDYSYTQLSDINTAAIGQRLYLLDEVEVADQDAALFRFISVGDTAYFIQNKATGLYLRAAGGSGAVTLSVQPTIWKNQAMGYGKVMTTGTDILGNNNNNLHTQRDGNFMVTWSNTDVASNTGFLIEEAEEVGNYVADNTVKMSLTPNAIYGLCYPVDLTPATGNVYGVEMVEGTDVTLKVYKDNTAKAGMPFIYITGDLTNYDEEAKEELYSFTYGSELNIVADTTKVHRGSYFGETAPKGSIIATGEGELKVVKSNTDMGWNSTVIRAGIQNVKDAVVKCTIGEGEYTAIKTAVSNAINGGKIYTIDGTYVGKGNINTVKGLKKGLYIVNGVKVMVK